MELDEIGIQCFTTSFLVYLPSDNLTQLLKILTHRRFLPIKNGDFPQQTVSLPEGNHPFEGSYVICGEARTPTYPRPAEWNSLTQSSWSRKTTAKQQSYPTDGHVHMQIYHTYIYIIYIYTYYLKYHMDYIYILHYMTIIWMREIYIYYI